MRKVIGIGETILDIIFRNGQPTAAVPGGSVFNGIVSLARTGVPVSFISETGNDRVGNTILQFMQDSGMSTEYVNVFPDGKSPVSLAYLNEHGDAEYIFYKDYPKQRLDVVFPKLEEDDIVVFGSYFALNPVLRDKVQDLLEQAREKKAIVYYDPNFRSSHIAEVLYTGDIDIAGSNLYTVFIIEYEGIVISPGRVRGNNCHSLVGNICHGYRGVFGNIVRIGRGVYLYVSFNKRSYFPFDDTISNVVFFTNNGNMRSCAATSR